MATFDADRLHHAGVVVRDLEAATRRYAEIFGMDDWEVREFGPDELTDVQVHGRAVAAPRFRTAVSSTVPPSDGGWDGTPAKNVPVTFELVQPLMGESPFQEFRFVRGQGISHLKLAEMSAADFAALRTRLAANDIAIAASMTLASGAQRHFIDTRSLLGGFLVEVGVPAGGGAPSAAGERWDHRAAYTRPDGVGPVAVFSVNHFGVVVMDTMKSLQRYHEFFGIEQWNMRDWRTEAGLLEEPFYRGEPVNHEYFTGLAPFRDFGFEIIQPTHGPSHYNREFRDKWGEGVHHMLLNIAADMDEWDRTREWLASIDVPLVMGADLMHHAAAFCYYDTVEALGGYILEALVRKGPMPTAPSPAGYVIDFAALTAKL